MGAKNKNRNPFIGSNANEALRYDDYLVKHPRWTATNLKMIAEIGTPSGLCHAGSMTGHWEAGAVKRELG